MVSGDIDSGGQQTLHGQWGHSGHNMENGDMDSGDMDSGDMDSGVTADITWTV